MATKDTKGKEKAISDTHEEPIGTSHCLFLRSRLIRFSSQDDRLWVDKYAPQSLQDLAVHKRKVDDVRRWLVDAFDDKGRSKSRVSPSFCFHVVKTWLDDDATMYSACLLSPVPPVLERLQPCACSHEKWILISSSSKITRTQPAFLPLATNLQLVRPAIIFFVKRLGLELAHSRYSGFFHELFNARGRIHVDIHIFASEARSCRGSSQHFAPCSPLSVPRRA